MPTDYLEDLINSVKQGPTNTQQNTQNTQQGAPTQQQTPTQNEQNQKAGQEGTKPVDDEEKIAQQVKKEDLQKLTAEQETAQQQQKAERSAIEKELDENKKTEIKSYGKVKIYRVPGKPLAYYFIPTTRPTGVERRMINTLKEATTRLISITPYKIRNPEERRIVYKQKVIEIIKNNLNLKIPESKISFYAEAVVREMVGYGLIDELIKDDNLEEIMIVGPKKPVYVFHREFEMMLTNIEFFSEQEVEELLNKIAREVGRRVDVASPLLDARLLDGSRVNATIPPASISGGTLTIRKFRQDPYSIIDLIRMGTLSSEAAAFLWVAVEGMSTKPANILISGGTGSGKTTLLNVLASFVPDRERIITIEDTAELNLPIKHWIRLESRPPGLEGTGELKMDILTKNSLRMRPDRILVGEIRHEEAFTLFTAMNTGHDGALAKGTLIQLSDGNIIEIEKLAEKYFNNNMPIKENGYEFVDINNPQFVPSLNKNTLKIEHKKILRVWRKPYEGKLKKIKLSSGKIITLTDDHPLYKIQNGMIEINSSNLKENDWIAIPQSITVGAEKEIKEPYLLGLIYGDGHVGQEHIEFVNKEQSVLNEFFLAAKRTTNNKVTQKDFANYSRIKFFDKKIVNQLNKEYKIPIGNKTKIFKFEEELLSSKNSTLAELIKGIYDCEAHVNLNSNCIQFSTSNEDLSKKLPLILQRFKIHSSIYSQEKDGKGNTGPYYRISIYGKENLKNFRDQIGFKHEKKKENLNLLLEKTKNSLDLFPNIEKLLTNARAEAKMTQKELSALIGNQTRSSIEAYENNFRNPSREQLAKIIKMIDTNTSKQLKILCESELRFEKIVEVTEEDYSGHVYDLTVEGNHNYFANGLLVSNCLGTVHANSPDETIIRLTSPPMNVPSIMMSGLDLIIVEHRYYDRKKGTIRRVSEIGEVYGALEGSPKTQIVYQRDPVKDTLERTLVESKYLKMLQNFTGMTKESLLVEIESRKNFLDTMVLRNIRGLAEVSEKAKKFIQEKNINM